MNESHALQLAVICGLCATTLLILLIFTTTLWSKHYPTVSLIIEKKTKSYRGNAICPRSHYQWFEKLEFKSSCACFADEFILYHLRCLFYYSYVSLEIKWDSYFSHLPPCPRTLPSSGRAAGQLQLCTLRYMGWGLPWGVHHVPGSSRVHVICGFSTLKETAKKWLAWLTLGPFPQIHESDQVFFPRGKCQGWGGYEVSGEKGWTIFLILPRESKFLFNTERGRTIALLQPSEET